MTNSMACSFLAHLAGSYQIHIQRAVPIFVIGRMNEAGLVADYRQVARPVLAVFLTNLIGVIGFVFRTHGHTNSGCQFAVNILASAA